MSGNTGRMPGVTGFPEVRMAPVANRYAFVDNARAFVVFLVVAMHSNVTYSGIGGWYYTETLTANLDPVSMALFGFYASFTQAWFMGFMFFVAGIFAARSLARRGSGAFSRERLARLGVPLLVYVFLITPFIGYALMNYENARSLSPVVAYGRYLTSFVWIGGTGPLWFAEALLVFSLFYAAFRALFPARDTEKADGSAHGATVPSPRDRGPWRMAALLIPSMAVCAFLIRTVFPIGSDVINLQISNFASYIILFAFGIAAGERGWLEALSGPGGMRWFWSSLAVGIPVWVLVIVSGGALEGSDAVFGGLRWQSAAYSAWESFVAIALSIGILAFFRARFDRETPLSRFLSANTFGVYMLHAPVLVAISLALAPWSIAPLAKHAVVLPLAYCATLAISALVRKAKPIAWVLR